MNKKIIHTVFEACAQNYPDNTAIVYGKEPISYQALNERATSIANALNNEPFIALFLPNSIEHVASILALLKNGTVFVPIDTLAPNERISKILHKATIQTIITDAQNFENLTHILKELNLAHIKILRLDSVEPNLSPIALKTSEDDPAYLVFTSGSTGEPKAILGMQKSLSHFIHWEAKEFGVDATFGISQLAGVTFDVSLRDIFVPLISGATLYIPTERQNIAFLAQWISENKLTLIHIVPSLFRLLMKEFAYQKSDLSHLKHVLLAGEALYGSDVLAFNALYKEVELVNLYGPSETTLAKLFNRINPKNITNPNLIMPLGKPISNTQVLILKNNKLAKIKQIGEIYIKTPFRSKGYLGDEALNNASFVQNPLNEKEDILYKTGDMGRYLEDESVEFVGRVDAQVKINGIRVELGEIEGAIKSYKEVENALIMHNVSENKEIILICYYIPKEGFSEEALRQYLIEMIPSYMMPNFFIKMEAFPLNFHGKIDKKALPKPENLLYMGREFIAPATKMQHDIADIFAQALQLKQISIDMNFTQMGGNSLKAISVVAKLEHLFKTSINIKEFFENQSVQALETLIQQKSNTLDTSISNVALSDDYPLSHTQRRLWVLDKMQKGLSAYNIFGAVRFEAPLEATKLKETIRTLVLRHEILRTTFDKDAPKQRIGSVSEDIFEALSVEDVQSYLLKESQHLFDLSQNLFYCKLINEEILFVNMHHIISDGWSLNVIIEELSALYQGQNLPKLTIQYKDYVPWQEKTTQQSAHYWQTLLHNAPKLHMPLDYPRGALQSFEGASQSISLDARLKSLYPEGTLFVTLLTLISVVLSRYSNQNDIVLGTPVANRESAQLLNQVGFYANTLVLRLQLDPSASFAQNVANCEKLFLEALAHQSYPFDKLIDELELDRDMSQNPLFNVMVVMQNSEEGEIAFDGIKAHPCEIATLSSKFDMTFNFTEERLSIEYNTNLFNASTIARVLKNIEHLIASIEPTTPLNTLEMLAEKAQLARFNATSKEYPRDKTIINLFEAQVEKNPDNIAVLYEERKLSYRELNERANSLAHDLRTNHNVQPDTLVPLLVERSEYMIVAILGVLKAGGAYLPIDSEYPKERIEYMLSDAKASLLVCDSNTLTQASEYAKDLNISLVNVEAIDYDTNRENITPINQPNDLAYVIYTSGSTGKPKGVMIEHGGFVNMMSYQIESFGVLPEDVVMKFASFSFDASVYETFLALLAGASYVISSKEALLDDFVALTQQYNVNTAVLNPTFLANIEELKGFKTLITAGESAIAKEAMRYAQTTNYINAYGPSEASICSTFYQVDKDKNYTTIPIGSSIANVSNYILDENLHEMPIGAIGELCIGGVGLARGYLNQPNLTAQKFIEHPKFGRIYRTGDIARYLEDGNIEYLGRMDDQVKIRGFRIELGEIESALLQNAQEACVLVREGALVAYVVGEIPTLQEHLPAYMIPNEIIALDSFPLTPNGKVDKQALLSIKTKTQNKQMPTSLLQEQLCAIYSDVLGVDVGIDDSFFSFGGDSIKAIQVTSRLASLGYKLEVKELFSYPKIKDLASFVTKTEVAISQEAVEGALELNPIQQWFFESINQQLFNQSTLLSIHAPIDALELKTMLLAIIEHHDILRADYTKCYNNAMDEKYLDFASFSANSPEEIYAITQKMSASQRALIRFAHIRYNAQEYLYISAHHLIIDGVSWRILIEDLTTLYKKKPLPPKTHAFQTYAKSLSAYAKTIEAQEPFWQTCNIDYHLPHDATQESKTTTITLDEAFTKRLLEETNSAYNTTTQDILLLALNQTLFTCFNQTRNIIALESHGRDDALGVNVSRTIGWFTALYPLMLTYHDTSLDRQIKEQKEAIRQIPHSGIGYGVLKYIGKKALNFPKEVLFNYLGEFSEEGIFSEALFETAPDWSPDVRLEFKLDFSLVIVQKHLQISLRYEKYSPHTIERLLQTYKEALVAIVEHCQTQTQTSLTPNDIDDDAFDINALDDFLNNLDLEEE